MTSFLPTFISLEEPMARGIEASEAMVLLLSRSELSLTKCHGTLKPQHAYSH